MKWDVLHNFISPVTGYVLADTNYVLVGNNKGIAVPSPILIDIRLDLIDIRANYNILSNASFVIGFPNNQLPNAQILNSLPDGFMFNTAGIVSTKETIPMGGLPDLPKGNIWIGDADNRPIPNEIISIDNLPVLNAASFEIIPGTLSVGIQQVWQGTDKGRPEASYNISTTLEKINFALSGSVIPPMKGASFVVNSYDPFIDPILTGAQILSNLGAGGIAKIIAGTGLFAIAKSGADYVDPMQLEGIVEEAREAGRTAGATAGAEAGAEAGTAAGAEAGTAAGTAAGAEAGTAAGAEAGATAGGVAGAIAAGIALIPIESQVTTLNISVYGSIFNDGLKYVKYITQDSNPNSAPNSQSLSSLGGGILKANSSGVVSIITITGTTNQITVTNGNGALQNPIISISDNPVLPGNGGVTLPSGITGQEKGIAGTIRFNTKTRFFEGTVDGTNWAPFSTGSGSGDITLDGFVVGGPPINNIITTAIGPTCFLNVIPANADVSFFNFRLLDVATPIVGTDGVNKNYVDDAISGSIGDITLGGFVVGGSPDDDNVITTYRGPKCLLNVIPADDDVNFSGFRLLDVALPIVGTDGVNKNYVDDAISGSIGDITLDGFVVGGPPVDNIITTERGPTCLLTNIPAGGDVSIDNYRVTDLYQSPEGDFDAISTTFLWDLIHDRVDILWS